MDIEAPEEVDLETVVDLVATHGPFLLTKTGVTATRESSFEEWAAAFEWSFNVEKASAWWVGALAEYGEPRFGEKYSQVLEMTGYAEQTVKNAAYVHRHVPPEMRRADVPFSHHAEVAPLPKGQQEEWLNKCETDGLTREQLRVQIRASKAVEAGTPLELWLLVKCSDVNDQIALADKLKLEGRVVKLTTKEQAQE